MHRRPSVSLVHRCVSRPDCMFPVPGQKHEPPDESFRPHECPRPYSRLLARNRCLRAAARPTRPTETNPSPLHKARWATQPVPAASGFIFESQQHACSIVTEGIGERAVEIALHSGQSGCSECRADHCRSRPVRRLCWTVLGLRGTSPAALWTIRATNVALSLGGFLQ